MQLYQQSGVYRDNKSRAVGEVEDCELKNKKVQKKDNSQWHLKKLKHTKKRESNIYNSIRIKCDNA